MSKSFRTLCVLVAIVAIAAAFMLNGVTVHADGTIGWGGQGKENLPCANGGHWVVQAPGATSVTGTVNGTNYSAHQNGNGSWAFDSGPLGGSVTASASYTGTLTRDKTGMELSHCLSGSSTATPTATATGTATGTATSTATATECEGNNCGTSTPTATSTCTEDCGTATATATATATEGCNPDRDKNHCKKPTKTPNPPKPPAFVCNVVGVVIPQGSTFSLNGGVQNLVPPESPNSLVFKADGIHAGDHIVINGVTFVVTGDQSPYLCVPLPGKTTNLCQNGQQIDWGAGVQAADQKLVVNVGCDPTFQINGATYVLPMGQSYFYVTGTGDITVTGPDGVSYHFHVDFGPGPVVIH